MTTVAVMQPYFMPYAGYFRLFAAADLFVVFDCVQFPRRGWVHRNRLPRADGKADWLTLPLARRPREALIRDMAFAADAAERMAAQCRRFPALARGDDPLVAATMAVGGSLVDYLERLLGMAAARLGLPFNRVRSSAFGLADGLAGQERVIAAARAAGATRYVNLSGGVDLYDPAAFADAGLALAFLPPYRGPGWSILQRLLTEDAAAVAADIRESARGARVAEPA